MALEPGLERYLRRAPETYPITDLGGSFLSSASIQQDVIEDVLREASYHVEERIAQFRAFLVVLLATFEAQNYFWTGKSLSPPFLLLTLSTSALALIFSFYVLTNQHSRKRLKISTLAILSIGIDTTLMVLPTSLFFSPSSSLEAKQAILNQPAVFAMYLLVIASGLRFRQAARLGIAVNACVIFSFMLIEAIRSHTLEGFNPAATLAIRQHVLLLASSILLAWLISTHTRTTTLRAAQSAQLATVDGLTGVYNRHYLTEQLITLTSHPRHNFHLIMLDIDHFKQVNDRLGHLEGDRVLAEVASRLQRTLRVGDLLARYGGEEFCIVLTRVTNDVAQAIAERLRNEVAQTPIGTQTITLSLGLSAWDHQEPISSLLARADQALYQAKQEGRNRVITFWPPPLVLPTPESPKQVSS